MDADGQTVIGILCRSCHMAYAELKCSSCDLYLYCSDNCQRDHLQKHYMKCSVMQKVKFYVVEKETELQPTSDAATCGHGLSSTSNFLQFPGCGHTQCAECSIKSSAGRPTLQCLHCNCLYDKAYLLEFYCDSYYKQFLVLLYLVDMPSVSEVALQTLHNLCHQHAIIARSLFRHFDGACLSDFHRSASKYLQNDTFLALRYLTELLNTFGEQPWSCYLAIKLYLSQGDYDQARHYTDQLRIFTQNIDMNTIGTDEFKCIIHDSLARIEFHQGNWEQAIILGQKVIQTDSTVIEAFLYVAQSLVHLQRKSDAILLLQQGIEKACPWLPSRTVVLQTMLQDITQIDSNPALESSSSNK